MESVIFGIDVKSVGMYGEPFAFAWSLIDLEGKELDHGCYTCPTEKASGNDSDRKWIEKNVTPYLPKEVTHRDPDDLCEAVYQLWIKVKTEQKYLGVEVLCLAFIQNPAVGNLFSRAVTLDTSKRKFEGPFPLYDLSTALLIARIDLKSYPRNESEQTGVYPLNDARYTSRLFLKVLEKQGKTLKKKSRF